MKKLLILSGKGGTGKTTIASSFIELSKSKAFADCDVDAPNLELVINPKSSPKKSDFYGLPKASIDNSKCIKCGNCKNLCKFGAISIDEFNNYIVDPIKCEGCSVCTLKCPTNAIKMKDNICGNLKFYDEDFKFSTAKLKIGEGNSGKLVTKVKEELNNFNTSDLAIIDGSPGIGCPVIASITGVDFVLIVAEPSFSGFSDLKRIIKTVRSFNINMAVCINKYDINTKISDDIENYCTNNNINFVGKISYDKTIPENQNMKKNIINTNSLAKKEICDIYNNVIKLIK